MSSGRYRRASKVRTSRCNRTNKRIHRPARPQFAEVLERRDMLATDFPTPVLATTFESLIYTSQLVDDFAVAAEVDQFQIELDAGQTVAVVVTPTDVTNQLSVTLNGHASDPINVNSSASFAGETVFIQATPTSAQGVYTLDVEEINSLAGGGYTIDLYLNTLIESEPFDSVSNDSQVSAMPLGPGFIDLAAGVGSRTAVTSIGPLSTPDFDWYEFTLADGESASVAIDRLGAVLGALQVFDDQGQRLARGVDFDRDANDRDLLIADVVDQTSDGIDQSYFVQVRGILDYHMLVTRETTLDWEINDDLSSAQELVTTNEVLGNVDAPNAASTPGPLLDFTSGVATDSAGPLIYAYEEAGMVLEAISPNPNYFLLDAGGISFVEPVSAGLRLRQVDGRLFDLMSLEIRYPGTGGQLVASTGQVVPIDQVDANLTVDFQQVEYVDFEFTTSPGTSISFDNLQLSNFNDLPETGDFYQLPAMAGDNLSLSIAPPIDGPFFPVNTLEPRIELFDASGTYLAGATGWDVPVTFPVTADGDYYARVAPVGATAGSYLLAASGFTAVAPEFFVSNSDPEQAADLVFPPTEITLDFSDTLLTTTWHPTDIFIDGVNVGAFVQHIDGNTFSILPATPLGRGNHTLTIAAGAFSDVQGHPIEPYTLNFYVDDVGPTVIDSTILNGDVLATDTAVFVIQFNEPIDPATITASSYSLVSSQGTPVTSHSFDPATNTLTITAANLEAEQTHTLTLFSSVITDLGGNFLDGEFGPLSPVQSGDGVPGGDFEVTFTTNADGILFPGQFARQEPNGSLVYQATHSDELTVTTDEDEFLVDLEAGQVLSIVGEVPASPLDVTFSLFAPDGNLVSSATSVTSQPLVMQSLPIVDAGVYTLLVQGDGVSTGLYDIRLLLNSAVEIEAWDAAVSNDQQTDALDITASFQGLPGNLATRGAVQGAIDNTGSDEDWYRFEVGSGDVVTVAASENVTALELHDSTTILGAGQATERGLIVNRVVYTGAPGPIYVRVAGAPGGDYQLVATVGTDFEAEDNDTPDLIQAIGGSVLGFTDPATIPDTNIERDFPGINQNDAFCICEPPDAHIAVGSDYLLQVVNTAVAVYDKDGNVAMPSQDIREFFDPAVVDGDLFMFDPVVAYDELLDRYIVVVLSGASPNAVATDMLYAISDTGNPLDGFSEQHRVDFSGISPAAFADYPKIGWNADAHVVSVNMFSGSVLQSVNLVSIDKSTIADADPTTFAHTITQRANTSYTIAIATMHDSQPGDPMWLVEESGRNGTQSTIRVTRMDDLLTTPTLTDFEVPVATYQAGELPPADQPGGTYRTNDSRMLNAEWRDGRLLATHAVLDNGLSAVRWYEFDVSGATPTTVQDVIVPAEPGVSTFFPSIAINAEGDIGFTYMQSSASEYVSMYVNGQEAGSAPNTLATPRLVKAGDKTYLGVRGGDYSGMVVDPFTDTFWAANEVILTGAPDPLWSTWIAEFTVRALPDDDWYEFSVNMGDQLTLATWTPGDAAGDYENTLDVQIDLYDPNGNLIASDDDSAADGVNASVSHLASMTGLYQVRVRESSEAPGEYHLVIDGATGADPAPFVSSTFPIDGARVASFPASVVVDFSEPISDSTVTPDDLKIDGVAATGVNLLDVDTYEFTLDPAVFVGDGVYTLEIEGGNVLDYQAESNSPYNSSFVVDNTGPHVVSTLWNSAAFPAGSVVSGSSLTVAFEFDEPLFTISSARKGLRSPSVDDILLFDYQTSLTYQPTLITYDPVTFVIEATFGTIAEGDYQLTLVSGDGAFEDQLGNALDGDAVGLLPDGTISGDGVNGGDYVIDFSIDDASFTALQPFQRLAPLGSLAVVSRDNLGLISGSNDVDRFTLVPAAGDRVAVVATPDDPSATLSLTLDGIHVATGQPGQPVYLAPVLMASTGVQELQITSDLRTEFDMDVVFNATHELAIGDSADGAEFALDPSVFGRLAFGAVNIGTITPDVSGTDADEYTLDLNSHAGDTLEVIFSAQSPTAPGDAVVELLDSAGATIATAVETYNGQFVTNFDAGILDFTIPAGDEYTLRVSSAVPMEYSLAAFVDAVFDIENGTQGPPAREIRPGEAAIGHVAGPLTTDVADAYELTLAPGQVFVIETESPRDRTGAEQENMLDPFFTIVAADGAFVITETSSAADGKNARATVSSPNGNTLTISVGSELLNGEYLLRINEVGASSDINGDGEWDCADVDPLVVEIANNGSSIQFDLNRDGNVDIADLDLWLSDAAANNGLGGPYLPGDANLDGFVDISDYNIWNSRSFNLAFTGWCSGDFNADGFSDVSDLNLWNFYKFNASVAPDPQLRLEGFDIVQSRAKPVGAGPYSDGNSSQPALPNDWIAEPGALLKQRLKQQPLATELASWLSDADDEDDRQRQVVDVAFARFDELETTLE